MEKRRAMLNAIMAATQVIVVGLLLFALYRFLLKTIGVEKIGVWSLVLATTSVTRIAELGFSGSVVKFVSKYLAKHEEERAAEFIETAVNSVAVMVSLAISLLYPALVLLVRYLVPANTLSDALLILPYAVGSLWLSAICSVVLSGLDGVQRADLRSLVVVFGQMGFLGMVYFLVPQHGMQGLATCHVIQSGFVLLAAWTILKNQLTALGIGPYRWSRSAFREMFGYAINFQINGIAQLLFDPTTKTLLSKFGGLSLVGYYEMANRMVMQTRGLLVAANQVVVPVVATLFEREPASVLHTYKRCCEVMLYLGVPVYSLLFIAIPEISELWLGKYEHVFVTFSFILVVSWSLNTLTVPAYFAYMGIGRLRWNTACHVLMGGLNLALGYSLGKSWGGVGVVTGSALALVVGSAVPVISFHIEHKLGLTYLFPKESRNLAVACMAAIVTGLLAYYGMRQTLPLTPVTLIVVVLFGATVGPLMWQHKTGGFLLRGIWELRIRGAPGGQ